MVTQKTGLKSRGQETFVLLLILFTFFLQAGSSSFRTWSIPQNHRIANTIVSLQNWHHPALQRIGGTGFLTIGIDASVLKPKPFPANRLKPTATPSPAKKPLPTATAFTTTSSGDSNSGILAFIYGCFVWVIIPLIILSMLIFSLVIVYRAIEPELKVSVRAGLLAGLVLFVIYVVSQLQTIKVPNFSNYSPHVDFFSIIVLLLGFCVGFVLLWVIRLTAPTRLVGLLTLILSSASLSALFSYFFASNIRDVTLFFALSTVFGILVHVMFFPKTLREIFA